MLSVVLFLLLLTTTTAKIVGGSAVSSSSFSNSYPYLAQISRSRTGSSLCTASVIGRRWILYAAHCMSSRNAFIRVGNRAEGAGTAIGIRREIAHPSYNSRTLFADIALIETTSDIPAPVANVAGFNANTPSFGGRTGTAAGWGWLSENTPPPGTLHDVQIGIDSSCRFQGDICTMGFAMSSPRGWFTCTCYGDSGGPLILNGTVLGVVSRGPAPCEAGITYYADSTHWGSWLRSTINSWEEDPDAPVEGTVVERHQRTLTAEAGEDCITDLGKLDYIENSLGTVSAAYQATKLSLDRTAETAVEETATLIHRVLEELWRDKTSLLEFVEDELASQCTLCSNIRTEFDDTLNDIAVAMSTSIDSRWESDPLWQPVVGFIQVLKSVGANIC